MKALLVFALFSSAVHAQVTSAALPAASAVTAWRPVVTVNGGSFTPHTGTGSDYGIAINSAATGGSVNVATTGMVPCEFDSDLPTSLTGSFTAVPLNGMCHWDTAINSDSDVCSPNGVIGRIIAFRPDMGTRFATVALSFPGRRGTKPAAACIPDLTPAVQSIAQQYPGPAGPQGQQVRQGKRAALVLLAASGSIGPAGATGAVGATGPSGTTYIGTCVVAQIAALNLTTGFRSVTCANASVVAGGTYFVGPTAVMAAGYGVLANGFGTAAGTVSTSVYAPTISTAYSFTVGLWRMN